MSLSEVDPLKVRNAVASPCIGSSVISGHVMVCSLSTVYRRARADLHTDCGHSPMMHTCFWNNEILTPIQKHGMQDSGQIAFKKLRVLLDRIMLRRTKIQRADDLGLPPRTVIVRRDYFSPEEKELYLSLFSDAKRQFSTYVGAGTLLNSEYFTPNGTSPHFMGTTRLLQYL